jgi:hypothetical protein
MFFALNSWVLGLLIFALVLGGTCAGIAVGRSHRHRSDDLGVPLATLQGALLGLVGLLLAFGLAMAVDRYETRRATVVEDANAIGTAYLRAQTLSEPVRSRSLQELRRYTDAALALSRAVPDSDASRRAIAATGALERSLWSLAGEALRAEPQGNASRLYVDALNRAIDMQTVHVAVLRNRVPGSVLVVEIVGAVLALGVLGLYLAVIGRGLRPVLLAAALVALVLLVTFDLDRPTRGAIQVPAEPLTDLRASMAEPPAARP